MTQVEKASDRLHARNIRHDIMGEAIVLNVWDIDLEEVYDFLISQEEVEYYANEYDAMTEDNQSPQKDEVYEEFIKDFVAQHKKILDQHKKK